MRVKILFTTIVLVILCTQVYAAQKYIIDIYSKKQIDWLTDSDIHIFDFKAIKVSLRGRTGLFKINCPHDGIWVTSYTGQLPDGIGARYFHISSDGARLEAKMRPRTFSDKNKPNSPDNLLKQANTAYDIGNYKDALALYIQFYTKFSKHRGAPFAMFMGGQILCIQKKYRDSIALHKTLIKLYPKSSMVEHAFFRIACVTAGHLNKPDEGIKLFSSFLSQKPKSRLADDCLFNIAALHLIQGKTKQSIQEFTLLLKLYPKSNRAKPARENLAQLIKSIAKN